jgi:hypothetical protein
LAARGPASIRSALRDHSTDRPSDANIPEISSLIEANWHADQAGLLNETDDEVANRQTASLAGLAVTLLLAILGSFLVRGLHADDIITSSLNPGRANPDPAFHATKIPDVTSGLTRTAMRSVRGPNS